MNLGTYQVTVKERGSTVFESVESCSRYLCDSYGIHTKADTKLDGVKVWHRKFDYGYEKEAIDVDVRIEEYPTEVVFRYWHKFKNSGLYTMIITIYQF